MLTLVVIYLAGGLLLWVTAHMLAPVGYSIELSRGIAAAVLICVINSFLTSFLNPIIGLGYLPVVFIVNVFVVKGMLWLPFWRSFFAVLIYWMAVMAVVYLLFDSSITKGHRTAGTHLPKILIACND
jgi:hypothetical protein